MTLEILPNKGFKLNSDILYWKEKRKSVRKKLKNLHKEDDTIIEMSHFFDDNFNDDINQKRDIYQDINGIKNYFFLNYDKNNLLCELEVHWGIKIIIDNIEIEFEKDINPILNQLNSKGHLFKETQEGNYLFEKLKIVIANSKSIGGNGNDLSYLYSGLNIEHLIEN